MNTTVTPPKNHSAKSSRPHVKIIRQVAPVDTPQVPLIPVPKNKDSFHKISQVISAKLGSPTAFGLAALLIIVWAVSGPLFHFSDTWQLVINTTTTIVTFLMVFAIQNTQNRDSRAVQLKLNELVVSSRGARTEFVDIEDLTDSELDALQEQFRDMHRQIIEKDNANT